MATIKSYSDLQQSKKLAEILPLESADMYYAMTYIDSECNKHYNTPARIKQEDAAVYKTDISAWSLAALISVLPNGKDVSTTLSRGCWNIESLEYADKWWCEYEDDTHTKDFSVSADSPIDACVEMILKLNELNLL